ncbi:sulfate/thiosulfate ABC transporter permease CysT [Blochmannia endosymbiont of Camponotus (Colobopsis) obliquus]|uniref:sulfate/thiosulfate ABC transporter permease CysT n=1 Tax=Blochmannia endosymbiont of Camponotus (Colobopsis) obliquus TaxID=1505597 RepID=UPI00061A7468|nr:Sulfate transport system permease protein CysT [Blochmannia endosymbiont of Camponotus (Colobopsis) obliquus]
MFLTTKSIFPAFKISLGSSLFFICLICLLPLSALMMQLSQMNLLQYWSVITDPELMVAYQVTVVSAAIAACFNALFGMLISWMLVRCSFPGKFLLDVLIDLPFALPTAVAGLTLSALFANTGWYGRYLSQLGISISYTWLGIVIAMIFTSLPFVIRTVQPVLESFNREYEEVAKILGANRWQIFCNIIFPEIAPSLLIGTTLSFIRSLGEFGAVIFISGNIAWKTEVVSLIIFMKLQEFDYPAASAIASVILVFSLLLLFMINIIQSRFGLKTRGN